MDKFPNLSRWPLMLGAATCIGIAVYILLRTDDPFDEIFAAIILIVIGSVLVGAFIADQREQSQRHSHRDNDKES